MNGDRIRADNRMKILYFAPIYYDDMKQRPQQIAECLAKNHEVYYVEPTISLVRWLIKRGRSFRGDRRCIRGHLTCIRLNGRFTFHKSIEILDVFGINNISEYRQIKALAEQCNMIWVGYSGWYTLVRRIKGKPVIFDRMDEEELLVSSRLLRMTLRRNKKKLLQSADTVFVTSIKFYEELKGREHVYYVPNAVSKDFISAAKGKRSRENIENNQKVIFGYVGTVSDWFDFDVIRYILNLSRRYYIVLVGRNMQPVFRHDRVKYLGICLHDELAEIIHGFDVCLYNFKKSELLDTINPVKIYEYLALKKPVLAVYSKETRTFGKYVMLYHNAEEIKRRLAENIDQPFASEEEYMEFISKNTWAARAAVIEDVIDNLCRGEKGL